MVFICMLANIMNINIPDKIYKLLILIGLIVIGYTTYQIEKSERIYFSKINQFRNISESISLTNLNIEFKIENIENTSRLLSKTYSVENPIIVNDSLISFNRVLTGLEEELIVSDSIQVLWADYLKSKFYLKLLQEKEKISDRYFEDEKHIKEQYLDYYGDLQNIGVFLFITGFIIWFGASNNFENYERIKQHEKVYSHCQSCGGDFTSMRVYGTNKDKTLNYAFCNECYVDGDFTDVEMTKEEFKEIYMRKFQKDNWVARMMAKRRLSFLERWIE